MMRVMVPSQKIGIQVVLAQAGAVAEIEPAFATLEQSLILRRLGVLDPADSAALRDGIGRILG